MFLKLRIICTVIAALFIAAALPAAVWGGGVGFGICAAGALCFYFFMRLCKQSQEREEEKNKLSEFLKPQSDELTSPPSENTADASAQDLPKEE